MVEKVDGSLSRGAAVPADQGLGIVQPPYAADGGSRGVGERLSNLSTKPTPLPARVEHRGWSISYDPPPIPWRGADWQATHPDYDAIYEGEEDGWVSNGKAVQAGTREELIIEIDAWEEENGD